MVSVIIVNYNTFRLTCDCIESIIKYTLGAPYEIILVDNASTNCNPDEFLTRFPSIKLVKSAENGGFAKGNNLGIKYASGDIILLLNSDTLLTEDSISMAAKIAVAHPDVGPLTVRLTYPDGKLQHTARRFRSIRNEVLDLFRPVVKLLPYRKSATLMLNQYFNGDFDTYCDWISGAFFMFRAPLLQKLPEHKLDERFFMYGEDELWCYQFLKAGYRSYYYAGTTVIHLLSASTDSAKQLKLAKTFISREMEIMEYAHGKSVGYYIFGAIFKAKEMSRYVIKVMAQKIFNRAIR